MAIDYKDVEDDPEALAAMLAITGGERAVPVILEDGKVTVGFGGA